MNNTVRIIGSVVTAFIIGGAGSIVTAMVDSGEPTTNANAIGILMGLVAGAKDFRTFMATPPK